jgi:NADH-quinone oxidoreductase subunit J
MELAFYTCALVAILATLRVVTNATRCTRCSTSWSRCSRWRASSSALGAPFAGALEVIVYAGAIMVLFVFVVMMLNLGPETTAQERQWLKPATWIGPMLLSALLLGALVFTLVGADAPTGGA